MLLSWGHKGCTYHFPSRRVGNTSCGFELQTIEPMQPTRTPKIEPGAISHQPRGDLNPYPKCQMATLLTHDLCSGQGICYASGSGTDEAGAGAVRRGLFACLPNVSHAIATRGNGAGRVGYTVRHGIILCSCSVGCTGPQASVF